MAVNRKNQSKRQTTQAGEANNPPADAHDLLRYVRSIREILERFSTHKQRQSDTDNTINNKILDINTRSANWAQRYTIVTAVILIIMAIQAMIAWQSFVDVQRAFVSIKEIRVLPANGVKITPAGNAPSLGPLWYILPIWENTGNTPTRHLKTILVPPRPHQLPAYPKEINGAANFTVVANEPKIDFAHIPDDSVIMDGFLAPKHGGEGMGGHVFNGDRLKEVADLMGTYYLWGVATYDDVFWFTGSHITRYYYVMNGLSGDPMDAKSKIHIDFMECQKGNCTDDECHERPSN